MGRVVLGILAGILIAGATVWAVEAIIQLIWSAPADFNMRDPEAVRARVASLPAIVIALVLVAWMVGTALGSWAAVRIGRLAAAWPGLIVGAVIFALTLYTLITIPHPMWFVPIALIGIPLASWIGAKGARGRVIAPATP
jgi:hypothetical protein